MTLKILKMRLNCLKLPLTKNNALVLDLNLFKQCCLGANIFFTSLGFYKNVFNNKKFTIVVILLSLFFTNCQTAGHLPVPGESGIVKRKVASEYLAIADTYNELEKFDKAIEYYELAAKDKTIHWAAYYKLARCYAMNKQYTKARKMYFVLYKRDTKNIDLQLSLAYLYAMEGNLDKAEIIYAYLWKVNPNSPDALINYIDILIANKKYAQANSFLGFLKERFSDNTNITTFENKLKDLLPKDELPLDEDEKNNVLPADDKKGKDNEKDTDKKITETADNNSDNGDANKNTDDINNVSNSDNTDNNENKATINDESKQAPEEAATDEKLLDESSVTGEGDATKKTTKKKKVKKPKKTKKSKAAADDVQND